MLVGRAADDRSKPESDGADASEATAEKDLEEQDCSDAEDPNDEASLIKSADVPRAKAPSADSAPKFFGVSLKWLSLAALTVQTSGQVLLIKWARAEVKETPYISSTVVCFVEILKTAVSLLLVLAESGNVEACALNLRQHFLQNKLEVLKAAVPSLVYTIQNNLMFYSLEKLSAPVQQVLYQMKILTTAGLGVLMLGKTLTISQWIACFMLTAGITMVQWPRTPAADVNLTFADKAATGFGSEELKGFAAVLTSCVTSGFAGVYIQKMMQQASTSIWMRNVQFGLFGSIMGLLVAAGGDGAKISSGGFLQGYSIRVVLVILMNALGGLLCAAMLKYAGATLGCFSTALSIVLTCVLSATLLQDFIPDLLFVVGSSVAVTACLLYGLGLPEKVAQLVKDLLNCAPLHPNAMKRSTAA